MSNIVEVFRKALMERYSDELDMEMVSDISHFLGNLVDGNIVEKSVKETMLRMLREARQERSRENSYRWRHNRPPVDSAWFSRLLRHKVNQL